MYVWRGCIDCSDPCGAECHFKELLKQILFKKPKLEINYYLDLKLGPLNLSVTWVDLFYLLASVFFVALNAETTL